MSAKKSKAAKAVVQSEALIHLVRGRRVMLDAVLANLCGVLTKEGIAMLSSVRRSPRTIEVNIAIMRLRVSREALWSAAASSRRFQHALEARSRVGIESSACAKRREDDAALQSALREMPR